MGLAEVNGPKWDAAVIVKARNNRGFEYLRALPSYPNPQAAVGALRDLLAQAEAQNRVVIRGMVTPLR